MMKKLTSILCLMLAVTFCVTTVYGAGKEKVESFTITYSIKSEGEMDAQTKASLPTKQLVYYKGKLSRTEVITPMGSQIIITDGETKELNILLDIMGNKLALKTGKEDFEKAESENSVDSKIVRSDETKEISGYKCLKAEITYTIEGEEQTITVWYTKDIPVEDPNWSNPMFKDLGGILMEYSSTQNEITSTFTATEVKSGKLKDFLFTVPPGYQQLTQDEFKEMLGG